MLSKRVPRPYLCTTDFETHKPYVYLKYGNISNYYKFKFGI